MKKENLIILIANITLLVVMVIILKDYSIVPIHYDIAGEPDSYGSKYILFGITLLPIALAILMDVLPKIDPNKENYKYFSNYYKYLKYLIVVFFDLLILTIILSFIVNINVATIIAMLVATLLYVIGYIMPKIKQNYFVGIKTPWTLKDELVWDKTHKMGRKVFYALGTIILILGLVKNELISMLGIIIFVILIFYLFYYSYKVYKEENMNNK